MRTLEFVSVAFLGHRLSRSILIVVSRSEQSTTKQMRPPKMVVDTMIALYFHLPSLNDTTVAALNVQIRNVIDAKSRTTAPCK